MKLETLVLNSTYEPLLVVHVKEAYSLICREKVDILKEHDNPVRGSNGSLHPRPAVLRLRKRINPRRLLVKFSREAILRRDSNTCQYCSNKFRRGDLTLDHIIPKSRGGEYTFQNIAAACFPCNNRKGSRTPEEASMPLLRKPKHPLFPHVGFIHPSWEEFLWT